MILTSYLYKGMFPKTLVFRLLFLLYLQPLERNFTPSLAITSKHRIFKSIYILTSISPKPIFLFTWHLTMYNVPYQYIYNSPPSPKLLPPTFVNNIITPSPQIFSKSLYPTPNPFTWSLYSICANISFPFFQLLLPTFYFRPLLSLARTTIPVSRSDCSILHVVLQIHLSKSVLKPPELHLTYLSFTVFLNMA